MRHRTLITALAVATIFAVTLEAQAAPIEHVQSWTEAVHNGSIEGDPAYYYNGHATPAEYHHALITATNQIVADQWLPVAPWLNWQIPSIQNVADFCPRYVWEYRDTPGEGYWPQTFADDYNRYDSLVMFDDFYGPVVFLWPQAGRVYEHPAGGYDKLIVCWTDQA